MRYWRKKPTDAYTSTRAAVQAEMDTSDEETKKRASVVLRERQRYLTATPRTSQNQTEGGGDGNTQLQCW
jgi:hypothetical protein